ncbi:MAG: type II toxin-antitoxin system RelE family toxin [Terriglobia bacterium]
MSYRLLVKPSAKKELELLDDANLRRVDAAIMQLVENPRRHGTKKLTGMPLYRLRIGQYRVVYEVDDARSQITVITIGHRREVYRR